jgi:hypothetical protein
MELKNVEQLFYVGDKIVIIYCTIEFLSIVSVRSIRRIREYPLRDLLPDTIKIFLRRIFHHEIYVDNF